MHDPQPRAETAIFYFSSSFFFADNSIMPRNAIDHEYLEKLVNLVGDHPHWTSFVSAIFATA